MPDHRPEDRINPHEKWLRKLVAEMQSAMPPTMSCIVNTILQAADEIGRLHETLTCPSLTVTASTEQIKAVLHDWDKGRPVNTQDLINALAWRVANQRREIARLQGRLDNAYGGNHG
ncbi:MAG TPA: hypothetical protein VLH80_07245 [Nitrospiraceae bacterium]|nr:hypothetical protein [Nitrospiraceae bacterium]